MRDHYKLLEKKFNKKTINEEKVRKKVNQIKVFAILLNSFKIRLKTHGRKIPERIKSKYRH